MDNLVPVHVGLMGHIDHGKTALAKALSEKVSTAGLDKHPQAQQRGITIDLGFTMFVLDNYLVTLVDAPGHADLIRSVVAGSNIIDAAILVVSADEGPMIQTGEHLVVLQAMGVERILVVVAKTDLVQPEKLARTEDNVRAILTGTSFVDVEFVRVSALKGDGIDELRAALLRVLTPRVRDSKNPLSIPIDHAFPVKGHGTVVTGTIQRGSIRLGETVEIAPLGITSRVRSIQTFGEEREIASAGDRVGVNVPEIDDTEIARGDYLCTPGSMTRGSGFIAQLKVNPLYRGRITKRMTVSVSVGMPAVTGQIIPFTVTNDARVIQEMTETVEFTAALLLQKPIALTIETKVLLLRTDLPPTQMRIIGSGEVIEIPEKIILSRPRVRTGKVQRIRDSDVLVEGLASSKEVAEQLVGSNVSTSGGVVGVIKQTFGTRGVVAVEFEGPVKKSETANYQSLTEEEFSFGQ
ncbi:MAG: selenocysteine-specific translation elongation factor [Candidatus Thorarchaeota archaeon]|jgi:selenocysteine-specific elongation factor